MAKAKKRTTEKAAETNAASETKIPYLTTAGRLPQVLAKLKKAAVPPKLNFEFLRKLGFGSSNDRAYPSLFRRLGFIDGNGAPTDRYKQFRNETSSKQVLGLAIRDAYADLFQLDTEAHSASRDTIKGLINQLTGKDANLVEKMTATFIALRGEANFDGVADEEAVEDTAEVEEDEAPVLEKKKANQGVGSKGVLNLPFRCNIEIHLPPTNDISVFNAIFKALKDHLLE